MFSNMSPQQRAKYIGMGVVAVFIFIVIIIVVHLVGSGSHANSEPSGTATGTNTGSGAKASSPAKATSKPAKKVLPTKVVPVALGQPITLNGALSVSFLPGMQEVGSVPGAECGTTQAYAAPVGMDIYQVGAQWSNSSTTAWNYNENNIKLFTTQGAYTPDFHIMNEDPSSLNAYVEALAQGGAEMCGGNYPPFSVATIGSSGISGNIDFFIPSSAKPEYIAISTQNGQGQTIQYEATL